MHALGRNMHAPLICICRYYSSRSYLLAEALAMAFSTAHPLPEHLLSIKSYLLNQVLLLSTAVTLW